MISEYARDLGDPDRPIREALAERAGKPIKIRIQPMILRTAGAKGANYQTWKQIRWTLQADTVAEVQAARDAMRAFFEVLGKKGPIAVREVLAGIAEKVA